MNALEVPVRIQAHGNWFSWKPLQIKEIQNNELAMFITEKRGEDGLVGIADTMMELDNNTQEFKDFIEDRRKEGVRKRIQKLDWVINNLETSLRYDLETKNIKADPLAFASSGEVAAYKERLTLTEGERKDSLNKADEIRKLKAQISGEAVNGSGSSTHPGAYNPGHTSSVESAKGRK